MGKKKHDRKHGGKHGKHDKHDKHHRAEAPFGIPPHVAGIAAAAIEQVNTPAFRQMIVGALGAAAQAFDQRRPQPAAPTPPGPAAPPEETDAPSRPPSAATLAHEAEQAIERAAVQAGKAIETAATIAARVLESASEAMARWAAKQAHASGEPMAGERVPD